MKKIHSFDEVFDSQKMFRLILRAMSNPSAFVNISEFSGKLFGENPEFLALAMTLLDNEVSFYACGDSALEEAIVSLTLAKKERQENADFIFVTDTQLLKNVIESAKCGTLSDPHKSATIIVKISDAKTALLRFCGPGINGLAELKLPEIVADAIDIRDSQFYEYPQGVDFIFISADGNLFAIPRLISGVPGKSETFWGESGEVL